MDSQYVQEKRRLRKPTKRKPLRQLYVIASYDPRKPKDGPVDLGGMMFGVGHLPALRKVVAKKTSEQLGDDPTIWRVFRWHETDGLVGLPIPQEVSESKMYSRRR
jgi:hypothetical protein